MFQGVTIKPLVNLLKVKREVQRKRTVYEMLLNNVNFIISYLKNIKILIKGTRSHDGRYRISSWIPWSLLGEFLIVNINFDLITIIISDSSNAQRLEHKLYTTAIDAKSQITCDKNCSSL